MRYVLLKLTDEGAEKFIPKAGKKVLGVWEVPTGFCTCDDMYQTVREDWTWSDSGHPQCKECGGLYKPLLSLGARLRTALGRNIVRLYR